MRSGTAVARVPVAEFKEQLKQALRLPVFSESALSATDRSLVDRYRQAGAPDLETRRAELQAFLAEYGDANAEPGARDRLADMQRQLGGLTDSAGAIRDINARIDRLVDDLISNPRLERLVYSQAQSGIEFNLLRSYVRTPSIPAATFVQRWAFLYPKEQFGLWEFCGTGEVC